MAPKEDVNDIVQSFVDNDLASLDRIGGESDTFMLSPHLAQPSPDLESKQGGKKFDPASGKPDIQQEGMVPGLKPPVPGGKQAPSIVPGAALASEAKGSSGPNLSDDSRLKSSNTSPINTSDESKKESSSVSKNTSPDPLSTTTSASDRSKSRHVSTNSTASVSTLEREKRSSIGDKFKKFGKRITSGSKK